MHRLHCVVLSDYSLNRSKVIPTKYKQSRRHDERNRACTLQRSKKRFPGLRCPLAVLMALSWTSVAPPALAKQKPVSERKSGRCRVRVRGRRVWCSYTPSQTKLKLECHCGWRSYFEDELILPVDRQGQGLRELKPLCKTHARERCALQHRPVAHECRHKASSCEITQRYQWDEENEADLYINCDCGPKLTHSLRWSIYFDQPSTQPLSPQEVRKLCQSELQICKDSGLAHRDHFKLDPYADPKTLDYTVDCGSAAGFASMNKSKRNAERPWSHNWFRCLYTTPVSYDFPRTQSPNVLGRCLERLRECDPSGSYARSRLPPDTLSSEPAPEGCDEDQSCEEENPGLLCIL